MKTRFAPSILVPAALALAASASLAAADAPTLIRVADPTGTWTVTKKTISDNGKVKIYDKLPLGDTLRELKMDGDYFALQPGQDYWFVFYPHNLTTSVALEFVKNGDRKNTSCLLTVEGKYSTTIDKWATGPTVKFLGRKDLTVCTEANFRKGAENKTKPGAPFITFLSTEPPMPEEEKKLRAFELEIRKENGITTKDPLGDAADTSSDLNATASPRDYWRLDLDQTAKPTEIKTKYRKLSLKFHPDRFSKPTETEKKKMAEEIFKRLTSSYERVLKAAGSTN